MPMITDSRHVHAIAPNLLARNFDVANPFWVTLLPEFRCSPKNIYERMRSLR